MGVFLPFETPGFNLAAYETQRAYAGVAHVGENHFACTTSRDNLIVDQIRCGARQDQIPPSLANDFVTSGEWN